MNIAFILPAFGFGGAERVVSILANAFAKENKVRLILTNGDGTLAYKLDERIEVDVVDGSLPTFKRWLCVRKSCKAFRADVAIAFMEDIGIMASTFLAASGVPVIGSERNDPSNERKKLTRVVRAFKPFATSQFSGYVFQTDGAKAFYSKRIQRISQIILNPLNIDGLPTRKASEIEKELVTVGRLDSQKNQRLLIEAFSKSKFCQAGYLLNIYGDGPLRDDLEKQVIDLGLKEQVILKGNQKDVLEKIKNASLFVFTSNYEGLPNALIEAMCIGLPCISTDCSPGGARMLIKPELQNGVIVPCQDTVSLVKAMDDLFENSEKREMMGKNAIQLRELVSQDTIVEQWLDYIKVVSK